MRSLQKMFFGQKHVTANRRGVAADDDDMRPIPRGGRE